MYNVGNEFVRRFDIMNTDEILLQLLKGQEQMQASIKELQDGPKKMQTDIKELQNAQVEMLNRQEQLAGAVKSIKITLENEVTPAVKSLTERQIDDSHRLQSIEKDVQDLNDNMEINEVIASLRELKVNH